MTPAFIGSVPGPLSQMTEWPCDAVDQLNVTVPAATVSGVGEKKSLLTPIVALWPPCRVPAPPYVGELLQPKRVAQTAMTMSERFCMTRLHQKSRTATDPRYTGPVEGGFVRLLLEDVDFADHSGGDGTFVKVVHARLRERAEEQ